MDGDYETDGKDEVDAKETGGGGGGGEWTVRTWIVGGRGW